MDYFGKTQNAVELQNKAEAEEQVKLAVMGSYDNNGNLDKRKLNDNLADIPGIKHNGENMKKGEELVLPTDVVVNGYIVHIDDKGNVTLTTKTSEEEINNRKIEIGDLVAYDPTISNKEGTQQIESDKLQYVSPKGTGAIHGNGNGNQTFTAKASNNGGPKWRTLDIDGDTITLISDEVIKTDSNTNFTLYGAIGYLYAEQELNEICKIYGYGYGADTSKSITCNIGGPKDDDTIVEISGTGARSIAIEDINKIAKVGETKNGTTITTSFKELNSSYGNTTIPTSNVYYPTKTKDNGNSGLAGVKQLTHTAYAYDKTCIPDDNKIKETLFNENYWIASRCFRPDSNYCNFSVRVVYNKNRAGNAVVCTGYSNKLNLLSTDVLTYAVRPVVILKSNVIDIGAGYDENAGWQLK